jgi:hypothetical protein
VATTAISAPMNTNPKAGIARMIFLLLMSNGVVGLLFYNMIFIGSVLAAIANVKKTT